MPDEFVIHPTWAKRLLRMRANALSAIPLVIMAALAIVAVIGGVNRTWGLAVLGALGAIAAYFWMQSHNQGLFVSGERFGTTNWLGIRRTFRLRQLERIDTVAIRFGSVLPSEYLVFVDASGLALFRTPLLLWDDLDLDALWQQLSHSPSGSFARVLTRAAYASEYEQLPWFSAADVLIIVICGIVGFLVGATVAGEVARDMNLPLDYAGALLATSIMTLGTAVLSALGFLIVRHRRRRRGNAKRGHGLIAKRD